MKENESKTTLPFYVGIGASAGGLEALQKLLTTLPPDTGFCFFIIQHLSPDYKSLLGEILSKYTEMPVNQVEDGMTVEANSIYVIQPGKNMVLKNGKISLSDQVEKALNLPIDMFFRSLAEEVGPKAIAIVLSGTGSDGTNAIKSIKEHDGLVMVQDVESSKFDGMPKSAIRTGLVDIQCPPEAMSRELQHISKTASKQPYALVKNEQQIDAELMKKVYGILKKVSNINFTHYKQTTILRRLERRMMLCHKDNLGEYVDFLFDNPDEARTLSREVLIGVTNFFRDPEFFDILKEKAVKSILESSDPGQTIRVWVAGCSTGEEAYSIAILFCEAMEELKIQRNLKIFATDLDVESITTAGKGVYGDNIVDSVSPLRLSKYFTRKSGYYVVSREVRRYIVFSPHNVFQDPPFGRLDLISCRNMLIYFQNVLQNDLFSLFHTALKDRGFLFLGKSEAIGAFTDAFPVVDPSAKLFTHRADVIIPNQKIVPFLQTAFNEEEYSDDGRIPSSVGNRKQTIADVNNPTDTVDTTLLEKFMPACLVVDEKNDVVHLYGENSNFVHLPVGKFSNNVFDLISDALKIPASTILKEARQTQSLVQYKDISFHGEHEDGHIVLSAMPVDKTNQNNHRLYCIVFSSLSAPGQTDKAVSYDIDRVASQRITDLEQELGDVQGRLEKSIADQECVNEELQAANEELLTANEELQSSNEELQSVNEELYTVNSEYQQKLTELAGLNDDIANFLSSTMTGIIFVDNKLSIRRYTDYVAREFSVMDHDIGRSLKFISYHFPTIDIIEICDGVLKTLIPDEREITTIHDKVFFMRVAPYKSTENKILGCVITLVDVTTQKQGEMRLESTEQKLDKANETLEARADYLSRISHEIRTPMNALTNLSKLSLEQDENKEEFKASMGKISQITDYLSSIVTDFGESSRSDLNSSTIISEAFNLKNVVDGVAAMIASQAKDAGLDFQLKFPIELDKEYMGSETGLQHILLNFLGNGIKYTNFGSVSLQVLPTPDAKVEAGKYWIRFIISDTGIGIKKDFIPNMFKPFSRDTNDDVTSKPGMGLGLAIAKNLIDSMGGKTEVQSELGKGTVFTIDLPFFILDTVITKRLVIPDSNLEGCKAMVADDNALNRKILGNILSKEGMTFVEVVDGKQAVDTFLNSKEHEYNFILMDMRMPIMDGIKATSAIRHSKRKDCNVPIIGVSANGFSDDVQTAERAGVDEYVSKPINRERLIRVLKALKQRS